MEAKALENDSNVFYLAFLRIDMPGGGPDRMHDSFELPRHPSLITIAQLKEMVLEWGIKRKGPVKRVEIVTPLEEGDDQRTLEDWVKNPTQFQIDNWVKRENDFFREKRGAYGKWAVNFHYK